MRRHGFHYDEAHVPPIVRHLWDFFWKSERYRPRTDYGRWGSIPAADIEALSRGLKMPLTGWEWDALLNMDAARRNALGDPKAFEPPRELTLKDLDDLLG